MTFRPPKIEDTVDTHGYESNRFESRYRKSNKIMGVHLKLTPDMIVGVANVKTGFSIPP